MKDTPVSLLRVVLEESEDECTCDMTRDRCLHCRIKQVLDENAKVGLHDALESEMARVGATQGVHVERELVEALMDNCSLEKLARYCVYLNGRIDQLHQEREQFQSAVIAEFVRLNPGRTYPFAN